MASAPEAITVAAGQIRARLMNEAAATLADIEAVIRQAAERRANLLVLPECAYPAYLLGSVESYRAGDHLSSEAYIGWLKERAARQHMHVVSGFVEDTGRALHNGAVLIDDRGHEVGRARKQFLWNADHDWYIPGDAITAFDTAIGRVGVAICAETRVPEILATLVAAGAELIAVPTCWINQAREPGQYANPQVEFMIEARAREFGIPFICADKWGLDFGAVGYVGQSRILGADGSVVAEAAACGNAVITAQVVRRRPPRMWVSKEQARRLLSVDPPMLPPAEPSRPVKVAAVPTAVSERLLAGGTGEALFKPLQDQGVAILLANAACAPAAERLAGLARGFGIHAVGWAARSEVFTLGPARAGCVAGQAVCSFVASRLLVLEGAELLLYFDVPEDLALVRTRAAENRVFVMGANQGCALVIGPGGQVLAQTQGEPPAAAMAMIDLAEAGNKCVAPRTDIFAERRAGAYGF